MRILNHTYILVLCLAGSVAFAAHPRIVTPEQANELVMAALTPAQQTLPKLEAERFMPAQLSRFMFFMVTWQGVAHGSVMVGNYAVDPYTGDVWNAAASCDEETNERLRALQVRIRSNLHLSPSRYRQLKTSGPLCN